ncbi:MULTISPECIES: NUDIX domain-containing protein [unclassified Streptomyces]|uniref:NUDIX domain-containing protein n=1 Tax=unclassified Streptomyces TaxID=2593676 RepID=UPI0036E99BE6
MTEGHACPLIPGSLGQLTDVAPAVLGGLPSLLTCLAQVPDPRRDQGRRHPLAFVMSLVACVVLAGAKSLAAIAEWAADAPPHVLARLGGPCREPDRGPVTPAEELHCTACRRVYRRECDEMAAEGQAPPLERESHRFVTVLCQVRDAPRTVRAVRLASRLMSTAHLPPAQYYASLPKHIAGAGAIFHDADGRILLVQPSYRTDTWEIPGGGLDMGEDPLQTVRREVKEEFGIDLTPGRLLAVDWVPEQADGRPPLANYLFDGGPITESQARARIHLNTDELTAWQLAIPDQWDTLLVPHMARRLHACSRALNQGMTVYLHHGFDATRQQT